MNERNNKKEKMNIKQKKLFMNALAGLYKITFPCS